MHAVQSRSVMALHAIANAFVTKYERQKLPPSAARKVPELPILPHMIPAHWSLTPLRLQKGKKMAQSQTLERMKSRS